MNDRKKYNKPKTINYSSKLTNVMPLSQMSRNKADSVNGMQLILPIEYKGNVLPNPLCVIVSIQRDLTSTPQ